MKTQSALLRSLGALLALLVFIALASPTARASQGQCPDVEISSYSGGAYYVLEVGNGCYIYLTTSNMPGFPDPSRYGADPVIQP